LKVLDNLLRKKFPKYKNIYIDKIFGANNLSESKCELIFLYTNSNIKADLRNLIYKKILYYSDYEDWRCMNWDYDEHKYKIYINLLKVNNQIQVIIGEDVKKI